MMQNYFILRRGQLIVCEMSGKIVYHGPDVGYNDDVLKQISYAANEDEVKQLLERGQEKCES